MGVRRLSEMIERVARAAHDAQWEEPFPVEGSIAYAVAIQVARAAIEAMRKPTAAMYEATDHICETTGDELEIYHAFIDAALTKS